MDKKKLGLILMGVSVVVLIFAVVLFCVSAEFVDDIEDAIIALARESGDYNFDIDIDAGLIRELIDLSEELDGANIFEEMYKYGISVPGFAIFALFSRGWFLAAGILLALAGLLITAFAKDGKLGSDLAKLAGRFGKAVAAAFTELFASIPMPVRRAKLVCPNCGASCSAGMTYCGNCGCKLPDPASVGVCKHCGARNDSGAHFCAGCGQPLD